MPSREQDEDGAISAVAGTRVTVHVEADAPLDQPLLVVDENSEALEAQGPRGTGRLTVKKDGHYRIAAKFGDELVALTEDFPITAVPDQKPNVEVVRPGRDYQANAIEEVPVRLRANDDYRHRSRAELGFAIFSPACRGPATATVAGVLLAMLEERTAAGDPLDGDVVRRHLLRARLSRQHRDLNAPDRLWRPRLSTPRGRASARRSPPTPPPAARCGRWSRSRACRGLRGDPYPRCAKNATECRYPPGAGTAGHNGFTGIDDPYEVPERLEIVVDTRGESAEDAAERILAYLAEKGFLSLVGGGGLPRPLADRGKEAGQAPHPTSRQRSTAYADVLQLARGGLLPAPRHSPPS